MIDTTMKRFLLAAGISAFLLAACGSRNSASLLDASLQNPSGFTGIQTMNACAVASGDCFVLEVDSDGTDIKRIHYPTDVWVETKESGCSNGYCWATDANGAEWHLEP